MVARVAPPQPLPRYGGRGAFGDLYPFQPALRWPGFGLASAWLTRGFWHAVAAALPLTLPGHAAYNEQNEARQDHHSGSDVARRPARGCRQIMANGADMTTDATTDATTAEALSPDVAAKYVRLR